ncbi:MAG: helix-turn-helix transcriptional regulator [Kiritimatiellae bacterium]|nr:helix-turn-helix transcriptional regulator [Kiritimatiellia bacterium]
MLVGGKRDLLAMVGDGLKRRRLHLNVTREEAAERSGISPSTLKNIEAGRGGSIWALASLCRTYNHTLWIHELAPEENIDHQIAMRTGRLRLRASRAGLSSKAGAANV